jgi:hypothetical protein
VRVSLCVVGACVTRRGDHLTGEPEPVAADPDPVRDPDTLAWSDMLKNGDFASTAVSPPPGLVGRSSSWYSPPATHRSGYGAPVQRYDEPLAPADAGLSLALLSLRPGRPRIAGATYS